MRVASLALLSSVCILAAFPVLSDAPIPGHVCVSGCGGASRPGIYSPQPSADQLREQQDAKDLEEASDDAHDHGIEMYEKGNWEAAANYFRKAIDDNPDNDEARVMLARTLRKIREAQTARQLKAVNAESSAASLSDADLAKKRSGSGFDTSTQDRGSLSPSLTYEGNSTNSDPIVPASKRTPKITALEHQREDLRGQVRTLDAKISSADARRDPVMIAKLKQERSTLNDKINYLNFSVSSLLTEPRRVAN